MPRPDNVDLSIFTRWMDFLEWLLQATEKFPKRVRFTFADRINALALDLAEELVEARYTRDKLPILFRMNLRLEKLRVLLRLCHRLRYLSHADYEHAAKSINEVGRMLGGWIKKQREREQ